MSTMEYWCIAVRLKQPSVDTLPRPRFCPETHQDNFPDNLFGFRSLHFAGHSLDLEPQFQETGFEPGSNCTIVQTGFYAVEGPITRVVCEINRDSYEGMALFRGTPGKIHKLFFDLRNNWGRLLSHAAYVYMNDGNQQNVIPIDITNRLSSTGTTGD